MGLRVFPWSLCWQVMGWRTTRLEDLVDGLGTRPRRGSHPFTCRLAPGTKSQALPVSSGQGGADFVDFISVPGRRGEVRGSEPQKSLSYQGEPGCEPWFSGKPSMVFPLLCTASVIWHTSKPPHFLKSGFLHLSTVDILGGIILYCGGLSCAA